MRFHNRLGYWASERARDLGRACDILTGKASRLDHLDKQMSLRLI